VPYAGSGPAVTALLGGSADIAVLPAAAVMPQIKTGKIKALAITTAKRSPAMPDLPTVAESGLPGYEVLTWYGLLAPAATPKEIVARLQTEVAKILQMPDIRQRIADISSEPGGIASEQFADLIKKETVKWAKVVKDSGATID